MYVKSYILVLTAVVATLRWGMLHSATICNADSILAYHILIDKFTYSISRSYIIRTRILLYR